MRAKLIKEYIDWTGKWVPDKRSPFDKAGEYSIQQDLIKDLNKLLHTYHDRIKDSVILDALQKVSKKYIK